MSKQFHSLIQFEQPDPLSLLIDQFQFNFVSCGQWSITHTNSVTNVSLPYYRLACFTQGSASLYYEGSHFVLAKNDLLLTRPNSFYQASVLETATAFHFIYFTFKSPYLETEFLKAIEYQKSAVIRMRQPTKIQRFFLEVQNEATRRQPGYYSICTLLLQAICIEIVREIPYQNICFENTDQSCPKSNEIISIATKFIQDNLYTKITVKDIAKQALVSTNYLYKTFINTLKVSPLEYMLNCKISLASSLLHNSQHSISEIAYLLHFSSSQHFSSAFRKKIGQTPSHIRKNPTVLRK